MRLIDADALLEKIQFRIEPQGVIGATVRDVVKKTREIIMAEPSVDITPVLHAHWLHKHDSWHDVDYAECSNCHESWILGEGEESERFYFWNYCPSCGAKMN